jgi:pimeloyl-ACP methyl ester carboxylesterase
MTKTLSKSVVFITGTFIGNNCWDQWIVYFGSKGYHCLAPAWPHKDGSPEELRNRDTDDAISLNRMDKLTDYFGNIVNELAEKPILIGHSLGGLIVQLLLQRDLGVAGVAIHSFPPLGVNTFKFSFLKATLETMGFFTPTRKTYLMSFRKWKYAVSNGMSCDQQKQSYYKYAIPESKLIIRDTFTCMAKINFKNPHVPLLLTSGSRDKFMPNSIIYNNYKKYKKTNSITDYKDFKGRNHLVFDHPAWKEDADFILYWLQGIK